MSARFCVDCGSAIDPGAHFCANCGRRLDTAMGKGVPGQAAALPSTASPAVLVPWFILAALMMAVLGYVIGARGTPVGGAGGAAASLAAGDPIVPASDISMLSPEERVDRLFNRVMSLAAAGQQDSVQFFAPMAISALAALMPLDVHRRYDLGLIQLTAGDAAAAAAQADTILASQPSHLLGLALAMRAARAQNRTADAQRLAVRLTAASVAERAKGLREYADHAPDIADALTEARATGASGR